MAAAGSFSYLRDNASMKVSVGSSTTLDLSVECAGMLEKLMLAQAQECVFENTIAKGSTPGVCAKISRQVCEFNCPIIGLCLSLVLNYETCN
jgi:programmed cell death 6-interacting protein